MAKVPWFCLVDGEKCKPKNTVFSPLNKSKIS